MKKIINITLVLVFLLISANCSALDDLLPKTLSEGDLGLTKKPAGWTFLYGFQLPKALGEQLSKADGSVTIPGLSTIAEKKPLSTYAKNAIVVTKVTDFDGKKYLQYAFQIKIDGSKIGTKSMQYAPIPAAADKDKFAFYMTSSVGFVRGVATDCDGNPKKNVTVTSDTFISYTDSDGHYAIPAMAGGPTMLNINSKECPSKVAAPVPEKDEVAPDKGETPDTASAANPSDSSQTITDAPEAGGSGCGGEDSAPAACTLPVTFTATGAVQSDNSDCLMEVAAFKTASDQPQPAVLKDSVAPDNGSWGIISDPGTSLGGGKLLMLSTGGSVNQNFGTAAAIAIDASGRDAGDTLEITYTFVSQEHPSYTKSSFNDTFGFAFLGAANLSEVRTVHTTFDDDSSTYVGCDLDTKTCDTAWLDNNDYSQLGLSEVLSHSTDQGTSAHGKDYWGGISTVEDPAASDDPRATGTATKYLVKSSLKIPAELVGSEKLILVLAIADVYDKVYDSAVAVQKIDWKQ